MPPMTHMLRIMKWQIVSTNSRLILDSLRFQIINEIWFALLFLIMKCPNPIYRINFLRYHFYENASSIIKYSLRWWTLYHPIFSLWSKNIISKYQYLIELKKWRRERETFLFFKGFCLIVPFKFPLLISNFLWFQ